MRAEVTLYYFAILRCSKFVRFGCAVYSISSVVEFRSEQNDMNYNRDDKVLSVVLAWLTNTNHSINPHGGFITLQRDDGLGLYSTLGA